MSQPDFWDDSDAAQKISKQENAIKDKLASYDHIAEEQEELEILLELAQAEDDQETFAEIETRIEELEEQLE
jgi:peptide chain release factor 2